MILDVHEGKITIPLTINSSGDNVIVAGDNESWIYIHEIAGSFSGDNTMEIKSGGTVLANFELSEGQGLTLDDIPGDEGVPRFKIKPSDNFIINLGNTNEFTGSLVYSRRF